MPEIARAAGIWPKFFGGYWARHPQKFSLALISITTCHEINQVKQNATHNLTPVFQLSFYALSDGVLHFALCVAHQISFIVVDPDCCSASSVARF